MCVHVPICVHVSICVHTHACLQVRLPVSMAVDVGAHSTYQSLRPKVFYVTDWDCDRIKMTTASVPDSVFTLPFF